MTIENIDQRIVAGFFNACQSTELEIKFQPQFIQRPTAAERVAERGIDMPLNLMPIVVHPEKRVVLKEGQFALTRTDHPNPKFKHMNNIVLMRGTPYGVIVLYGVLAQYKVRKNGFVDGPIPHLHTTAAFFSAALRYFARKSQTFRGDWDLKTWIFSDTFEADLQEQAALDRANRIMVSDGLPQRIRSNHPAHKKPHDVESKRRGQPERKADFQHPQETKDHPLDIMPCRANGWKGKRHADQTPAERAAGEAMLARPEEQLPKAGLHAGGYPA